LSYKIVKYGKNERRNYSSMRYDVDLPNLLEVQTLSFDDFKSNGIIQILNDLSPIEGHNGDLKLYLDTPTWGQPKYGIAESKMRDVNYAVQLSCKAKLVNVKTGEVKESSVLLTEVPIMTPSGTFVINGAERVVVSQITRSSGAYFKSENNKKIGKTIYSAQIIPTRGAWLEFGKGKELSYAILDRSRKVNLVTFALALGFKDMNDVKKNFGEHPILKECFLKPDINVSSCDTAVSVLYERLRGGEKIAANPAREFIRARLFDTKRYDLSKVGRYKFNQKLDVLARARGFKLTNDIVNENGEIIALAGATIEGEVLESLKNNRDVLRATVISKEKSLENEPPEEILVAGDADQLFIKENITNTKTGEIIILKDTLLTDEVLQKLRIERAVIAEKVAKYFLNENPYEKESKRHGVFIEKLSITKENEAGKSVVINILGSDQRETCEHITVSDMVASISYYLNLYDNVGNVDDIDNLGNRRVRLIGELLKNNFRIGLARAEKNIKDKMSTTTFEDTTAASVINTLPLVAAIKQFFGSSQLSQFMDQINPLAELTQKRRVSALGTGGIQRDRASVEVRDVHNSHYGRICPIETPEGQSIGLISSLASYAKVNEYGFIQTPFFEVSKDENGENVVTDKVIYLTSNEELDKVIASAASVLDENGHFTESKVIGRLNGETSFFDSKDVTYMDVSSKQIISIATSTIPFLEHDDASRALMGANMQRQAVPLLDAEAPYVGTGVEHRVAKDSGVACVSDVTGYVVYVDAKKILILEEPTEDVIDVTGDTLYSVGKDFNPGIAFKLAQTGLVKPKEFSLINFTRSNQNNCVIQRPIVLHGEYVLKGDIIADGNSMKNGELALGRNVVVAFMTWEGYNYEDAVIMNEDLVKNDVYTSIHIEKYDCSTRDTKVGTGVEEITSEVPNASVESRRNLDEYGIIIPGSEVKEGDILVGKITPRGSLESTPAEKLMHAILGEKSREYRDSSLKVPHGGGGIVQSVQHFKKSNGDVLPSGINETVRVFIAKKRKIREGDKMAGRHGNKGVISRILPREDMPFLSDGTPVDIMLNPLGVPSRMNIGQILEVHLGIAAKNLGVMVATPVFDGVKDADLNQIMAEAHLASDGKTQLRDGRSGKLFDNNISVGVMYMIKLSHMVDDKLHARNVGPYTLVTQQPMGGKAQNGGQRFGEMEVWALYAYGAAHTLQEIVTIKSDDIIGRNRAYIAISKNKKIPAPSIPESFRVLVREFQGLGLYVELINAKTGENEAIKSIVTNKRSYRGGSN